MGRRGPVIDAIEARLKALGAPVEFIKIHNTPDGTFPNGIPNPLLPECRDDTRKAVIEHGADMGIAFDGDFDRCFLFDEKGQFIEGYYIVGLLAEAFLEKHPGAKIIHDPRLTWNTEAVVTAAGGTPVMSKTGHAFIKERMRTEDAIYGGEMSAHHYFRDFAYCDSGMIPWLLVAELACLKGQSLGELVRDRMAAFRRAGKSTAGWRSRRQPLRGWKRTLRKRRRRWTARTASACHSRTGVSICARRTPNRWCA
ncbi:phosphomannomutase [Salmonella enterica subsp. enterica]|uniref:Phosphomannomutase n=1 Tax=Salmonella enterica I TaxID=59201 RepID=A0A379WRQ4_SALET|nr:phosphomannomutase [Salmonella enterica subsp. enterica]